MAYRHYETPGLVLNRRNFGEANRFYQILTPDFGLVKVLAQGVRREKSKFRYQLETILVELTLIRGREFWRLVGVKPLGQPANSNQIKFSRQISSVLLRLVHGEEASHQIFNDLRLVWDWLAEPTTPVSIAEIFALIRLLSELGYLAKTETTEDILSASNLSPELASLIEARRRILITLINSSLVASGL